MFGRKEHSLLLGAAQEPREKRAFPGSPAVAAPGLRLCRQADADIVVSEVGARPFLLRRLLRRKTSDHSQGPSTLRFT